MQGVIADYFPARESGLIRALDGDYYVFTRWDWSNDTQEPATGTAVQFVPAPRTPIPFHAIKIQPENPISESD
ncbi:MAG TPA: hypothetical protein VL625_09540 [Patescibacteria group bacterium]|nr:hypothetical protein [Patescibacteria group bacterium]